MECLMDASSRVVHLVHYPLVVYGWIFSASCPWLDERWGTPLSYQQLLAGLRVLVPHYFLLGWVSMVAHLY